MVEELLMNVVNAMSNCLDEEQLDKLQNLLNRGMRIEEVMVLMGHTKIETTLIYCNIKQDNVRESYRKYAA